jgi:opine dehydrogenase
MTTTLQHESVAKFISPYVKDGQTIILCPGYMGSLLFKKYVDKDVTYCEWETTAYNGRIMDESYVKITFYNPRNAVSVMPQNRKDNVLTMLSKMFDNTKYLRTNILESSIHNPNMIVHTIGMLFSASRIEHSRGEFWMYKEAFTESVINVINNFDKQKNELLKAYGCSPLNYFDAAKWRNEESLTIDAMESFRRFAESSNKGPISLNHRYLLEDVPMGLCLFCSLGRIAHVDTSIAESIVRLTSALLNEDFIATGRTIENMLGKNNGEVKIQDVMDIIA